MNEIHSSEELHWTVVPATRAVVNCAAYSEGRRVSDVDIDDIGRALEEPGRFAWIGLHAPSAELLRRIQAEFRLHDLAVEDALHAHQRPKLEAYGDSLFVVLRTARVDAGRRRVVFGETHFFVGRNFKIGRAHV